MEDNFPQKNTCSIQKSVRKIEEFFEHIYVFTKKESRSSMDSELRKELISKFKPEVEELSKIAGRDLVALWGYDGIR